MRDERLQAAALAPHPPAGRTSSSPGCTFATTPRTSRRTSCFQETADRENFQGRYVLRHPWTGGDWCGGSDEYRSELTRRHEREAQALASLTGWNIADIRRKMPPAGEAPQPWWERIWK